MPAGFAKCTGAVLVVAVSPWSSQFLFDFNNVAKAFPKIISGGTKTLLERGLTSATVESSAPSNEDDNPANKNLAANVRVGSRETSSKAHLISNNF